MTATEDQAASTAAPNVQFRARGGLDAWLASRQERTILAGAGSLGEQARLELHMLGDLLAAELRAMQPVPLAWAHALTEVSGGDQMSAGIAQVREDGSLRPVLWAEWIVCRHDATASGHPGNTFAARYGLDEDDLDAWLRSLSPARDHAVRDALSRWWAQVWPMDGARIGEEDGEFQAVSAAGFAIVGLRVAA
jgi:hypothetical protein